LNIAIVSKNKGNANVKEDANNQGISAIWVQQDQLSEVLGQYPYIAEDNDKNREKRKMFCDKVYIILNMHLTPRLFLIKV